MKMKTSVLFPSLMQAANHLYSVYEKNYFRSYAEYNITAQHLQYGLQYILHFPYDIVRRKILRKFRNYVKL